MLKILKLIKLFSKRNDLFININKETFLLITGYYNLKINKYDAIKAKLGIYE